VSSPSEIAEWKFVRFGLIVTGKGEEGFLPTLFRSLTTSGHCMFEVIRRIGQRAPITSEKKKIKMTGEGKTIPSKDEEEIGLTARRYLTRKDTFVILIDDLESDRAIGMEAIFQRYRQALDTMLGPLRHRASVHFLVNMLEAYYFADAQAINAVLGTDQADYEEDVETIRHPKNELKRLASGFDEIVHGRQILNKLDTERILSRMDTCASLRTLFAWCSRAMGEPFADRYRLVDGVRNPITESQIEDLLG
jgi:hypothetical protein